MVGLISQEGSGYANITNTPKGSVACSSRGSFLTHATTHLNACALHSGTQAEEAASVWDTASLKAVGHDRWQNRERASKASSRDDVHPCMLAKASPMDAPELNGTGTKALH